MVQNRSNSVSLCRRTSTLPQSDDVLRLGGSTTGWKSIHARETVVPSEEGARARIKLGIEDNPEKPRQRLYTKTPPEGVMRLPPTTRDSPLPPPDEAPPEEPYEPSEPFDPSELLGPEEFPDELDLHSSAEMDPGHAEISGGKINFEKSKKTKKEKSKSRKVR
jgi:hypothetical protein